MHIPILHRYENWGEPVMTPFLYTPEREIGHQLMQMRRCKSCGKIKRRKIR